MEGQEGITNKSSLDTYKITCKDYPSEFILDKNVAKNYFRQFGKLKRITFRPKLRTCNVEYADKISYLNALSNAGEYKGNLFDVFLDKPPKEKKKIASPIWVDKDEIEAELEAMSGTAPKSYSLTAEVIDLTDSLPEPPKIGKPKLKRAWKTEVLSPKPKKKPRAKGNLGSSLGLTVSKETLELINIILSQATTIEEKYRVLDARDKLMRAKYKKTTHIKSTATKGTCPDMCPEKERLMRETQHQVTLYEQTENGKSMNQRKAVKQYSRSSADQETPLPHELRPVSVLQMTMGYLMHNIVDLCDTDDVNLAEWYHFLWDRTRGIRKDITQQELCCQGAVELVEQCARFHIHCSARLVGEEPSVFDQKINTENLTKCLQTLKYMYHDLQLKAEKCPNEAEFRAYIILLNLNDGNFMWEVQELRQEIQRSKEVKFAIDVYSALDKNNYVKFFKLVYSTTYLNACLMMRYFVQVRITAIKTFLQCFSPRAFKTIYPLSEIMRILAFDDAESTVDFMRAYGLSFNEENTHIIIEKNAFALPEIPYMLDRSNLVESKRTFSVGQIMCGKDLPPKTYSDHIPQNSFDKMGYLISDDLLEEAELEKAKMKLISDLEGESDSGDTEVVPNVPSKEQTTAAIWKESQKDPRKVIGVGSIFAEKKPMDPQKDVGFGSIFAPKEPSGSIFGQKDRAPISIFAKPFESTTTSIFGNVPQEPPIIHDQTDSGTLKNPEPFSKLEFPKLPLQTTSLFPKPPVIFEPAPFVPPLASEPKKGGFSFNLEEAVLPKAVNKSNIVVPVPLSPPVVSSDEEQKSLDPDMARHLEQILKKEQERLEQELAELRRKRELELKLQEEKKKEEMIKELKRKRLEEELQKRMQELRKQEQLREAEIRRSVRDVIDMLLGDVEIQIREEKLQEIRDRIEKRKTLELVKNWQENVRKKKRKRKAMDCSPVWISAKSLKESAQDFHASSQDVTLSFMARYKYGKPLDIDVLLDEDVVKINLFELTYATLNRRFYDLTAVVQKNIFWKVTVSLPDERELVNGLNRMEETLKDAFQWEQRNGSAFVVEQFKPNSVESVTYCVEKQKGFNVSAYDANGFIFVAKNFNSVLQHRIFENLKGFGVFTKVPIVIILQEYDSEDCNLQTLIEEKIVSDYIILVEQLTPIGLTSLVEEGLVFLASKVEKSPALELDTVSSFFSKYLCTETWKRANSFAKWNAHYKTCLRDPRIVISLYNEGLSKLKKIVLNQSCREYATFPEVFTEYLKSEIPDFLPCSYQYFPRFWKKEQYNDKLERILKHLALPKWQDKWPPESEFELEVNVSKYCTKVFKEPEKPFYRLMSLFLQNVDPTENFEDVKNVLWTSIVELLGLEKLREANLSLAGTVFENKSIYNQYFVVYSVETLENYTRSDWFYINNPMVQRFVKQRLCAESKSQVAREETFDLISDIDLDKTMSNLANQMQDKSQILRAKKEMSDLKAMLDDLETSIKIHKKISSKLEEKLKDAIEDK